MATLDLSTIIIPTPAPYDEDVPFKQLENLAYVMLQIFTQAKAVGFALDDQALLTAVQALAFNGVDFDLGDLIIRLTGKDFIINGI